MPLKKLLLVIVVSIPALLIRFKGGSNLEPKEGIKAAEVNDLTDKEIELMEEKALKMMVLAEDEIKDDEDDVTYERKDRPEPPTRGRGIVKRVPKSGTSMKSYMDYRAITNKSSVQYKLQQKNGTYTDSEGFRRIGNSYMVAIGTYFGASVGQEVEIELSSGTKFNAIVGDIKSDKHTDSMHLSHPDGSVVEFLVDQRNLLSIIRKMGDCSYSEANNFSGDVVSITVLQDD